jgi:macrolide-specific efflux system membrane fusion protein
LTEQGVQEKTVYIGLRTRRFAQVREGLVVGAKLQLVLRNDDTGKKKNNGNSPTAGVPRL